MIRRACGCQFAGHRIINKIHSRTRAARHWAFRSPTLCRPSVSPSPFPQFIVPVRFGSRGPFHRIYRRSAQSTPVRAVASFRSTGVRGVTRDDFRGHGNPPPHPTCLWFRRSDFCKILSGGGGFRGEKKNDFQSYPETG